jgi:hypothetical protein
MRSLSPVQTFTNYETIEELPVLGTGCRWFSIVPIWIIILVIIIVIVIVIVIFIVIVVIVVVIVIGISYNICTRIDNEYVISILLIKQKIAVPDT